MAASSRATSSSTGACASRVCAQDPSRKTLGCRSSGAALGEHVAGPGARELERRPLRRDVDHGTGLGAQRLPRATSRRSSGRAGGATTSHSSGPEPEHRHVTRADGRVGPRRHATPSASPTASAGRPVRVEAQVELGEERQLAQAAPRPAAPRRGPPRQRGRAGCGAWSSQPSRRAPSGSYRTGSATVTGTSRPSDRRRTASRRSARGRPCTRASANVRPSAALR